MRRIALLVLLVLLLPLGEAQRQTRPIQGDYNDVYMVVGRVVDGHGMPFAEASVRITITAKGYKIPPEDAGTNCRGEFETYYNLPSVPPGAKVTVEPLAKDATGKLVPHGSATARLDPFFRRTDLNVTLTGLYEHQCQSLEGTWNNTISVRARLLNKTVPYREGNETFEAVPYGGIIRMRYTAPDGTQVCPPLGGGASTTGGDVRCFPFITDERGDVKYTWTFYDEKGAESLVPSAGTVSLILHDNSTYHAQVHPTNRRAVLYIEATGQGAPPIPSETPFLALPALALAVAVALALHRRR